jgi:hypothetical protein
MMMDIMRAKVMLPVITTIAITVITDMISAVLLIKSILMNSVKDIH